MRLVAVKTSEQVHRKGDSASRPLTGGWTWLAIICATAAPYAWRLQSELGLMTTSAYAGVCAAVLLWTVMSCFGERRLRRMEKHNRIASLRRSALVQVIVTLGLSMTPSGVGLTAIQIPALLLVDAPEWGLLQWFPAEASDVSHLDQALGFGFLTLLAGMMHFVLVMGIDVLFGMEKPAERWRPKIPRTLREE